MGYRSVLRVRRFLFAAVLPAMAAACGTVLATTPIADRKVDRAFKTQLISWNDGGMQIILYTAVEDAGFAAVCGLWMADGKVDDRAASLALNHGRVEIDDTVIVRGAEWFRKVPFQTDLRSFGNARCVRTGVAWRASFSSRRARYKSDKSKYRIVD